MWINLIKWEKIIRVKYVESVLDKKVTSKVINEECMKVWYRSRFLCELDMKSPWWKLVKLQYVIIYYGQRHHFTIVDYRVSHSKEGKVNLLWWGDRFWFLLIFWVLRVHEIGSFMPHSSFFIEIMMLAFYGPKCKKAKINFGKKSLNVHSVKLFSKLVFQRFWGFFLLFLFQTFN